MKLFRRKTTPPSITRTEALACIPQHAPSLTWKINENGDVLIEYPLPIKPFFVELAQRFNLGGQPQEMKKKLQLDGQGSTVWQMIDGSRDVRTLISLFSRESGLSLQEAEIALTTFLRELGRRGLLILR